MYASSRCRRDRYAYGGTTRATRPDPEPAAEQSPPELKFDRELPRCRLRKQANCNFLIRFARMSTWQILNPLLLFSLFACTCVLLLQSELSPWGGC